MTFKLRLRHLTSTWPTSITKTTAFRRSSNHSLNQMSKLEKVSIESSKSSPLDTRSTMSSGDLRLRFKREMLKDLEEIKLLMRDQPKSTTQSTTVPKQPPK